MNLAKKEVLKEAYKSTIEKDIENLEENEVEEIAN